MFKYLAPPRGHMQNIYSAVEEINQWKGSFTKIKGSTISIIPYMAKLHSYMWVSFIDVSVKQVTWYMKMIVY